MIGRANREIFHMKDHGCWEEKIFSLYSRRLGRRNPPQEIFRLRKMESVSGCDSICCASRMRRAINPRLR